MAKLRQDERLRRLYMSYLDDGILDLFLGSIALLAALTLTTDMVWMAGVFVAAFLPVIWSVKEKITMPRLRRDDLDPTAAGRSRVFLLSIAVGLVLFAFLGVLFLLLFQNPELAAATERLLLVGAAGLIAAVVLVGFIIVGAIYSAPRWYVYAAIVLLFGILAWWLGITLPWVIGALGAVMALTGAVYLARFLRSHPILPESDRPAW
jgi:hypothetical protein